MADRIAIYPGFWICRPQREQDQKLVRETRETIRRCRELLNQPPPDTFLGRAPSGSVHGAGDATPR